MKIFKKYISKETKASKTAKIDKTCKLLGENQINEKVIIKNNSFLLNVKVDKYSKIENSKVENSEIGKNVVIGPYTKIRQYSIIEDDCYIGNFVEVKKSIIKKGTKAGHLAYIGDAEIGKNCNIGAGVVFANFNGKEKNKIVIGNNCFIGSNSTLIAPLTLGDNCFVAAGSVVYENAPDNTFIIGRAYQTNKENKSQNYIKGKTK